MLRRSARRLRPGDVVVLNGKTHAVVEVRANADETTITVILADGQRLVRPGGAKLEVLPR